MNVRAIELPAMDVALVAKQGSYLDTRPAWDTLIAWAHARGLAAPAQSFIGISLDDPFVVPEAECRYRACVTLPAGFEKTPGPVEYDRLPGGLYAVHEYYDSLDRIPFGYGVVLDAWLPRSGHEYDTDRPCLEICLNDPAQDPERKARLRICVPITAKR